MNENTETKPIPPCAWRPIKTAPTNGDVFIAFTPHTPNKVGGFQFTAYRRTDNSAVTCMMSGDQFPHATHWMPMHKNPKPTQKQ